MAAGGEPIKASLNSFLQWEVPENSDVQGVQNQQPQAQVQCIPKKQEPVLASSASAYDLRCSDTAKESQDASSPRGVIESCLKDLDAHSQASGNREKEHRLHFPRPRALSNWKKFFKSWKRAALKRLTSLNPVPVLESTRRQSRSSRDNPKLRNLYNFKSSIKDFTLSELKTATNDFSHENLIGKGGYAEVYKGCLPNGKFIAVKRLTKGNTDEKAAGFLSELGIIAHIDHPNTAKLLGSGIDGGMHLVFELSRLGSLRSVLHDPSSEVKLDWSKRYKIALGIANGLLYLHETCRKRIIHRDMKAENILLTEDFVPQICDFGLAKWLPSKCTHQNISTFEGTFGYFAPEYFMDGIVDEKIDVYAFGVILLELITGRPALDQSQKSLVIWAKPLLENNDIKELVDPVLGSNYDSKQMDHVVFTASLCIEHTPTLRPQMSQALILLRGDEEPSNTKTYERKTLHRTYSEELLDATEYNSTKCLVNITQLRQIALAT